MFLTSARPFCLYLVHLRKIISNPADIPAGLVQSRRRSVEDAATYLQRPRLSVISVSSGPVSILKTERESVKKASLHIEYIPSSFPSHTSFFHSRGILRNRRPTSRHILALSVHGA